MMSSDSPVVLIVDDERAIRQFLRLSLSSFDYQVTEAACGKGALLSAATNHPDLVILDLGLPDIEGVEVIRQLREWSQVPIIILSVREYEEEKIAALDAGADDYLTKPFGMGELMARMRAAMRRSSQTEAEPVFVSGDLRVDLSGRMVWVSDKEISLTPTEYGILNLFIKHAGQVLTHNQILRQVWGPGYEDDLHILRVNISNLRRKIEANPTQPLHIHTEPGVGYRLIVP